MMIVDASAIIAIMFEEAEASDCVMALQTDAQRLISAVNYVEAGTVMAGRIKEGDRYEAIADLDEFLTEFRIGIASIDENLARAAMKARVKYGKGFGTRGGLNFGDCFAYALAKRHSAPLLYVGDDFALTDVQSALTK
ncbi:MULTISPECIES: type II toxin-antitoxin system VapC family toxin [Rhizobium]|uniref:Ribonuclease VapC n=1 Tax=Rhizobium tropici TaxID=398 RepID=A0A329YFA5_RHITR|nr:MULTISPECIES: type II toxin-antitoxin system VapC family toxin [Rhizobium]MBB3289360.1 ribonuclease VapC [Rhizobium sp. BK252]MBB3404240.1 ribonuclease VapC [Rhizobium sp. BK289]MBB3416687.1 ribonuclease VapC [Rhizobium sp. BK284]MBB3484565.1 ribonuclease VapC [Rhizobium sp. BK347]MDK4721142.1 type II toxin-antitoxin system VapC family toxin [Rhizobium sp. CNPSo 3968]